MSAHAEAPDGSTQGSAYREAVAAFEAEDYTRAVRLFEEAYERDADPNHLYNIGRVYEEMGELQKAIDHYSRFMLAQGVSLDSRAVASERIAKLNKVLGQTNALMAVDDDAGQLMASPPPSNTSPQPDNDASDVVMPVRRGPGPVGIAGYSLLGIGGASLIASGVVGLLAMRENNRLEGPDPLQDPQDVQAQGRTMAWAADGLLIGGAVVAATGIALVITDAVGRKRRRNAAIAPALGRGMAGLSYRTRF